MSVLADAGENTPTAWSTRARVLADPVAACGWSPAGQAARFRAILDATQPERGESLLDYGCGTGMLAGELERRVRYTGWDWSAGMRDRARSLWPGREFPEALVPDRRWDVVVACGTFNLADGWSLRETQATVGWLWARTSRVLAVSLYAGSDPRCIRYIGSDLAMWANVLHPSRWRVERHMANDLLMVMWR